jgi:hypothetical protein
LPIVKIDSTTSEKVLHGELLDNNLFEEKNLTIMEYNKQIAALYTPFNENYFKPEKVLI